MASNEVLEALALLFNFSSAKLYLIPLYFHKCKDNKVIVKYHKFKKSTTLFWSLLMSISLAITATELYNSCTSKNSKSILKILYHTFLLLSKLGSSTALFTLNKKVVKLSHLFNCFFTENFSKFWMSNKQKGNHGKTSYLSENKIFFIFIVFEGIAVSIFYIICVPFVAFCIPSLHNLFRFPIDFRNTSPVLFRLYVLLFQIIFNIPVGMTAAMTAICCLVTLNQISTRLQELWYVKILCYFYE